MASPRYEPVAQQTGAGRNLITSAQLDALVEDAARKGGDLERLKSARLRIERAGAALRRNAAPPPIGASEWADADGGDFDDQTQAGSAGHCEVRITVSAEYTTTNPLD